MWERFALHALSVSAFICEMTIDFIVRFSLFARSVAARTGRRDEPCAARFKNEAPLRFSRGNLPRDPAAGPRTANAVRKAPRKAHIKKDMVSAVHSNGAVTVFSFPRKMRLRPTLRFDTRLAVHDLTRHRANLRARFPSAFAARCHPPQRGGQDKRSFLCSVYSKIHIFQ